jgi:hypothetical protein
MTAAVRLARIAAIRARSPWETTSRQSLGYTVVKLHSSAAHRAKGDHRESFSAVIGG